MYARILVIVENDPATSAAVERGVAMARESDGEVVFLSVVHESAMPLADFPVPSVDAGDVLLRAADRKAQGDLGVARQLANQAGVRNRVIKAEATDIAACVVETAHTLGCDLILVESLGRNSVMRLVFGSVIPGLITLSTVPVLVVRHGVPAGGEPAGTASASASAGVTADAGA